MADSTMAGIYIAKRFLINRLIFSIAEYSFNFSFDIDPSINNNWVFAKKQNSKQVERQIK